MQTNITQADDEIMLKAAALLEAVKRVAPAEASREHLISYALQAITSPLRADNIPPEDLFLGFAYGLGSIIAMTAAVDWKGLKPAFWSSVEYSHFRTKAVMAGDEGFIVRDSSRSSGRAH